MTTTPTLLDLCRQFDAAYVPGFNERFAAALKNKTELSPEDAACFETRMKIGDEIEKRLGRERETFEAHGLICLKSGDISAESALWSVAECIADALKERVRDCDIELARECLERLRVLLS